MASPLWLYALALIVSGLVWLRTSKRVASRRRRLLYPPGPKGYPLIGNLLHLPLKHAWLVYDEWFKIYGDMVYLEVFGQSFLVLGTPERAQDLFEKRSAIYSDRPEFVMLNEMMGWDFNFALMRYGPWWRRNRRMFHQYFNMNEVHKYDDIQRAETHVFLQRLLDSPEEFIHHIRHAIGAVVLKITYGISVQEENDPYIHNAEEAFIGATEAGVPGRFLVELIPAMKKIPSWFPGTGWRRWAEYYYSVNQRIIYMPFEYVRGTLEKGTEVPSVAASLIERLPAENAPNWAEEEKIAKNTAAVVYSSASDTTVSTIQTFFLAMCLYPEVQNKAQEELDRVVGGRLPGFSDRDSLPYVNAVIKECVRWQPAVPLIPHTSSEDDEYDGYFIPKGTMVIGSAWSMLHDPQAYIEPHQYMPERFLKDGRMDSNVRDPELAFGFGRRTCAGRHLSNHSLFIIVASVLAAFDIKPPLGEDGKPVELKPRYSSGLLSYPEPFEARIVPRSEKVETMLRGSELAD
ncbi:cytochrome P450 [Macrolepiota fuliginosa MF-IS2]|uniref:Cytochrome P450 n=1 Tax=Macrolepiota fuliginosa MF-IS2 TaxID=1400762 RepID=A0A9P5X3W5_9AGAR|nr:cytochrome P450 [Macrolepiota fuliginosa MF-IS2]